MPELMTTCAPRRAHQTFGRVGARLRGLQPEHPRVYAVAAMADQGKRRWWQLAEGAGEGRVDLMYRRHAAEMSSPAMAAEVVATALIHGIVGRVAALLVLEGRAWDPGLENLWLHTDNDGGLDWAGLADTTIRVVAGDPLAGDRGVLVLPCGEAMTLWLAQRCASSLTLVQSTLARCARLSARRFWELVGESVTGAATYVPELARTDAALAARRGEALLAALEHRGLAARRLRLA
ncbi:hypothetical protein D5S18_19855 [Nocardia panacis]|uniref:Iron reductase n=1 Tax=Nocardia panacis TaxID=2340916 RepID=A0A3A4KUC2_9NOCA|nr:hypothetical protein [Nocardia panacis]RJO73474.1 hypothetical protein D5S18_19855 [Nocardia panacis]